MISIMPGAAPYPQLHIYYFNGPVPESEFAAAPGFIGNWEEDGESFVFFVQAADEWIARWQRGRSGLRLIDRFEMTYEQWHGAPLAPLIVGRLHIIPAWHTVLGSSTDRILRLDPGVVFGTGAHPTTRDCLQAMQQVFEQHAIARVLDLGTGTGLLAMAAAAWGAEQVVAVDLNLLAARTARANVIRNDLAQRIVVVRGNAKNFIDLSCDLMVSNIHYDIMRQLIETGGFRRQKYFILSGLLRSQAYEIKSGLARVGAEVLAQREQDSVWFTICGRNAR